MSIRRGLLANQRIKFKLRYWYGLNRNYNTYDNWNSPKSRAASNDIFVPAGQTMTITRLANNIDVAVAAWDSAFTNVLYGSWNKDLTFTRSYDCTVRIVCRINTNGSFEENYFDGKVIVKVGNKTFITA